VDRGFNDISRGAGNRRDQGFLFVEQAVQEARLAGIDAADDRGLETLHPPFSLPVTGKDPGDGSQKVFLNPGCGLFPVQERHVLFREVYGDFDGSEEVQNRLSQPFDLEPETALDLVGGEMEPSFGLSVDEIDDRFGLGEVHAAVHESPEGELSGFGQAGAFPEENAQNLLQKEGAAVGVDLHHVLSGVGVGCGHAGEEDLVDGRA
jgi:hypothetical protein